MPQLPELVESLLKPEPYPEPPPKVELLQTQMSFIFLAGDYVYKVKKPVNLGYLDYTTLEKRQALCQKEVELNRRLCPDVYLGVVPITRDGGKIVLGGKGEPIEYAVKMRRLPADAMLNVLLLKNQVSPEMMKRVAQKVADFHAKAETSPFISSFGSLEIIRQNTEENFNQTRKYIGITIAQEQYQRIKDFTDGFIKKNTALFKKRVADGRIRDCHGDLHAAHICFTNGICIYDCIEFNDRFRYADVASEVSFLAMDLDNYGRSDLSKVFVDTYVDRSKDRELNKLLNYYKCYMAYVRGKVNSFQLDDPYISKEEKAKILAAAKRYFQLAESYTKE